jgi:hypothetical protein
MNYTITLSVAEDKALSYAAFSQQDWIDNAVHERARIAIDEIVGIFVQYCLDNNMAMPTSREEMVEAAFDMGIVKTAAGRQAEAEAAAQVMQGA